MQSKHGKNDKNDLKKVEMKALMISLEMVYIF